MLPREEIVVERIDAMSPHILPPAIYQFRDAIDELGGIAAINLEGEFISVTDSFIDLFGYSEEELLGKPIWILNYIPSILDFYTGVLKTVRTGTPITKEIPCRPKCGKTIIVRVTIAPSIGENGLCQGFIGMFQRVMPLHCDQLSDLFYRYRSSLNKLAAMAIVSTEGYLLEVNEAFTELYGYAPEEVAGEPIRILKSNETPEQIYEDLWKTISRGSIWHGELRNRRKDGSYVHVRSTISPAQDHYIHSTGNTQDAYLVIYQDNEAEIDARQNRVKLAVESTRQEMMSGALHNIGNTMQSVVAATERSQFGVTDLQVALKELVAHYEQLKSECDTHGSEANQHERYAELFEFVSQVFMVVAEALKETGEEVASARVALDTSISVLNGFRAQMKKSDRLITEFRLSEMLQQWLDVFSPQMQRHGIVVSVSEMPVEDYVQWPLDTIQQIVFNLLKNAKEAIAEQMASGMQSIGNLDISIRAGEGDQVVFDLRDNGGGFKIESHEIFKHGITTKTYGTGIGLHNASLMADSFGGKLSAENIVFDGLPGALLRLTAPRVVQEVSP